MENLEWNIIPPIISPSDRVVILTMMYLNMATLIPTHFFNPRWFCGRSELSYYHVPQQHESCSNPSNIIEMGKSNCRKAETC